MKFDTQWPADSVEFCPHPSCHRVFACGTYKLEEPDRTCETNNVANEDGVFVPSTRDASAQARRLGKCLFFEVSDDDTGNL